MEKRKYKAAIYRGVGKVDVIELDYPECGTNDVIVKNLIGGICGADVNAFFKGGDPHQIWKNHEFGHEMVSEVVEIGENIQGLEIGDYVWPHLGYAHDDRGRMATVGGFSEYVKIVNYREGYSAFKLDKSIPLDYLAMAEPFIIGTRGAKNTNPTKETTAIVFGAGLIGMSCAIMLKYYGCKKVMIVDLSDYRLKTAEQFGLVTCNSGKESLKEKAIKEFGSTMSVQGEVCGADVYVDCIGIQPIIDSFGMLAKSFATLVVVGVHHKPVTMNFQHLCYGQWNIKGSGSISAGDALVEIQEMMRSNQFDLLPLISHRYPIDKMEEALKMAGDADNSQRVVIEFQ